MGKNDDPVSETEGWRMTKLVLGEIKELRADFNAFSKDIVKFLVVAVVLASLGSKGLEIVGAFLGV